jgi:hypothetical protein
MSYNKESLLKLGYVFHLHQYGQQIWWGPAMDGDDEAVTA